MEVKKSLLFFVLLLTGLVYAAHALVIWVLQLTGIGSYDVVVTDHLVFFGVFLISGYVLGLSKHVFTTNLFFPAAYKNAREYLWFLILLCFAGGILNIIDKYLITLMRPIDCLSEIRFAWIEVSAYIKRSPIHSFVSFSGNALSSLLYPLLVILNISFLSANPTHRKCTLGQFVVIIFLILFYCASFGSRNLMFSFMAMSFTVTMLYLYFNTTKHQVVKSCVSTIVTLAIGSIFVFVLTANRVDCGWSDSGQERLERHYVYLKEFEDEIPINLVHSINQNAPMSQCSVCLLAGLYLSHGVANHQMVFNDNKIGENYLTGFLQSKLQFLYPFEVIEVTKYFRGGITMVGAVKHDYGYLGVLGFGLICAGVLKLILLSFAAATNYIRTFACIMLTLYFYSIAVSVMFFPLMTMPFSIMSFGFLLFWIFNIFVSLRDRGDCKSYQLHK